MFLVAFVFPLAVEKHKVIFLGYHTCQTR